MDLKEWFEANYLDGDKIQDGQMIASSECFEACQNAIDIRLTEIAEECEKAKTTYPQEVWFLQINKGLDKAIEIISKFKFMEVK